MIRRPHHTSHPLGVTLAELMIAIVIIGMLSSVAGLAFHRSLAVKQLETAVDRLITDLRLVRDQARLDNRSVTITFDEDDTAYTAPQVTTLENNDNLHVVLRLSPYRVSQLQCDLNGESDITFDPLGRPDTTGRVILHHGQHQRQIVVDSFGRIDAQE